MSLSALKHVRVDHVENCREKYVEQVGHEHAPLVHDHHLQQSVDQKGKVANPARSQLRTEKNIVSFSLFAPENLVSLATFGRPVPRQPTHSPHPD